MVLSIVPEEFLIKRVEALTNSVDDTVLAASAAVILTLPDPSNDPLVPVTSPVNEIVLPVARVVAVVALPERAPENVVAVTVPALKLPEPSLNTIVLTVFAFVAFDVTVNVPPSELTEPEIPLPDVAPC
jgi:hypothetical protein